MGNKAAVTALALVAVTLCGCGAVPQSKYYELQISPETIPVAAGDSFPVTLLVGPIKASHFYREDRLVYSTGTEEMGTYQLHRWAAPPTEMMQDLLSRTLQDSRRFRGVYRLTSSSHGDFILEGSLFDFKEVSGPSLVARITLSLQLRETNSGAIVWTNDCAHDEPVSARNVAAVVAALDRNAQRCVTNAETSLSEFFAARGRR